MDYNKSYEIYMLSLIVGIILMVISLATDIMWLGVIGMIGFMAGLLQTMIYYRCPKCNHPFDTRGKKPKHCPECGFKLEE